MVKEEQGSRCCCLKFLGSIGAIRRWLAGSGKNRLQVVFCYTDETIIILQQCDLQSFLFFSDLEERVSTEQKSWQVSGVN